MTKKRVGILRGGTGEHYHSSLQKGGDIISHVMEKLSHKYAPVDILIDKDHVWHCSGKPVTPSDLVHKVDVVWNLSHPSFSNILSSLSIPNIGASPFLGTLQTSRDMLKGFVKNIGLDMPRHIVLPVYQKDFDGAREKYAIKKAKQIFEKFGSPWIVKSFMSDSNMGPVRGREGSQRPSASNGMGIHLAKTFPELVNAIEDGVRHNKSILIEEFILGKTVSTHSLREWRGEDIYVFPPEDFSKKEKENLSSLARELHSHIGAEYYLKVDFILHPRGRAYVVGFSFLPDVKKNSHFSRACQSVGAKAHHVMEHILEKAKI